jgi:hypothetical protein
MEIHGSHKDEQRELIQKTKEQRNQKNKEV